MQSDSTQEQLLANAADVGYGYAASETGAGENVASPSGVMNSQFATGHMSSMKTQPSDTPSQQHAATDVYAHQYAHQTALG